MAPALTLEGIQVELFSDVFTCATADLYKCLF